MVSPEISGMGFCPVIWPYSNLREFCRARSSERPSRLRIQAIVALLFVLLGIAPSHAAPDDVEPPKKQVLENGQVFQMDEANFNANVFQPTGDPKQARKQLETRLKLQIEELVRVCDLNEAQQQKLKLAASSDMKRFYDEVDVVRKKVKQGNLNQIEWNNIWQEIQPLRTKMSVGLFGDTSFFSKAVRKTLTRDQMARYDVVVNERRRFRYRASIEVSLTTMESSVPLRHSQHEAIVKLLLDETQPPPVFGQYDQYLIMHQLAKFPEAKLKPLLEDHQWKQLQVQFNQYRGMEQFLIQNGLLPKEDDSLADPEALKENFVDVAPEADAENPENLVRQPKTDTKAVVE